MQGTQHAYMDRAIQKGIELPPGYLNVQSSTRRGFLQETTVLPDSERKARIYLTYADLADKVERSTRPDRFRTPTRKIPRDMMKDSIYLTYAGVAEKVDRRPSEVVDDSYDLVDLRDEEAVRQFDRRSDYKRFLDSRPELGLSLEKVIGSNGNRKFVHIMKNKSDGLGLVVDTKYVKGAVKAWDMYSRLMQQNDIKSMKMAWGIAKRYFTKDAQKKAKQDLARKIYVYLVEKGDWGSLKKAMKVAVKYFDSTHSKEASMIVEKRLNARAVAMADDAILGCLQPETSKEVYNRLVKMNKPSTLSKALDFARLYMNKQAVKDTADLLRQHLELKRMDQERDVRPERNKKAREGTRLMKSRQKTLKPILYMPKSIEHRLGEVRELQGDTELDLSKQSISQDRRRSARGERGITKFEAQCFVEAAENALRFEFKKRGGNILSEYLKGPSYARIMLARMNAEVLPGGSMLPPLPDLETYLAPPTCNDIRIPKKVRKRESTLPPHPLQGAAEPRRGVNHVKSMYNRPMNTGEPVTKRIVLAHEMKTVLRAA